MKKTEQYAKEILEKHDLTLTSEYLGAHKPVTFLCANGHENAGTATNVLQRGYNCKACKEGRPIVSKIEWTDALILKVQEALTKNSTIEVAKMFNTTVAAINNAVAKFDLLKTNPTIERAKEAILAQGRTLESEFTSMSSSAHILCQNGHRVYQNVGNILYKGTGCRLCNKTISNEEKDLVTFIKSIYSGWIIENDRSILNGKELDLVIPELRLAIEYNGTYWHSEIYVPKTYHLEKTIGANNLGFRVIHISSYDWATKTDLIKNKLNHIINRPKPTQYARKTTVKQISWAETKEFLANNHIQGPGAPTNINLYLENSVMTFRAPRFDPKADYELVRFASKNVYGAASKLLTHFIRTYSPNNIVSYALRDYSEGALYYKLGFTFERYTAPNFAYYKKLERVSRYAAQKIGHENLMNDGFYRMYDTGSLVFRLTTDS